MSSKTKAKAVKVRLHGEVFFHPVDALPKGAQLQPVQGPTYKVADSETTGNHHVVDMKPGVEFFKTPDNRLFLNSKVKTSIRCVDERRHDTMEIEPGIYEFGTQQEYDYLTKALRDVRD